ncbi:MAG: orotate phosphoribosyltransferase [Lachnospiraceae bacterium]|nr:orotate phosphoribosyltransferase [Lachnospiraceae bacterium]
MPVSIIQLQRFSGSSLPLRFAKGHFATNHSHINYYVDLTMTKHRLSEARMAAEELTARFKSTTIVDTILCLDGTEVIGACMASQLTNAGFTNMNAHQTIYVVTPEHTVGSQLLFRDNVAPMIRGKHVLILAASVTTGFTALAGVEAVSYYGGITEGICAIFAGVEECAGFPVVSVFDTKPFGDYDSYPSHACPLCKAGVKIDALVNTYGISSF